MEVGGWLHISAVLPQAQNLQQPFCRSLGEPHRQSGRFEEEKISYSCRELNPRSSSPQPSHYTNNAIMAYLDMKTKTKILAWEVNPNLSSHIFSSVVWVHSNLKAVISEHPVKSTDCYNSKCGCRLRMCFIKLLLRVVLM